MEFDNKTVLVTGGGSGIGAATAAKFAEYGAHVVVTDINQKTAEEIAHKIREFHGSAIAMKLDITKITDWQTVKEETHKQFGKLNVIFNNAYIKIVKPAHLTSVDEWDAQMSVNLGGIHKSVVTFMEDLQETHGNIVNTASVHAHFGFLGSGAYAATKGGIVSLSNQLAVEYGPHVRVNAVLPGPILTPVWDSATAADFEEATRGNALLRMGRPDEVAEAVYFLASDRASFITGSTLLVDGGLTVRKDAQRL
jgi:NAD(P)-dependent dehydrogenase (short-subunit alcohol dehydrogenase family)